MLKKPRGVALGCLVAGLLFLAACSTDTTWEDGGNEAAIRALVDSYAEAVNSADATELESLFWLDDPRFSEVENDRPLPLGSEEFLAISEWIREHGEPGLKQRFYETDVRLLSSEVAYSVSMRDEYVRGDTLRSRVTLIYLKRDADWRIIHGHFSYVPQ